MVDKTIPEYNVGDTVQFRWYGNMKTGTIAAILADNFGLAQQYMLVVEKPAPRKRARLLAVSTDHCGLSKVQD